MIVKGLLRKYSGTFVSDKDAAQEYDKYAMYFWGQ